MGANHAVIDAILRRRSVSPRRLVAPGPNTRSVELMVEAALAAPDHARLHPWRFVTIDLRGRDALAAVFGDAARELDPGKTDDAIQRELQKAYNAPTLIAIIARINELHPVVPAREQWMPVGAALQNILLAAEDLGFRAMIVSGSKVSTNALKAAFSVCRRS